MGLFDLYESADGLKTIERIDVAPPTKAGEKRPSSEDRIRAIAYGGNGNVDVIYAARNNQVLIRETGPGTPGKDFRVVTIEGASLINDIIIDPDDWRIVYAADVKNVMAQASG